MYTPRDAPRCQSRTAALTTGKVLYAKRRPTLSAQDGGSHDREGPIRRETPYAVSPGRRLSRQGRSYTLRDALRCQSRTAALTTGKVLYAERRPTLSVQNGGSHDREGPIRRETPYAVSPERRLSRQGRSYTPRDALRCQSRTAALTTGKVLYAERRPTLSVQNGGSHDREGPIRRETPYAVSPGRRLSRQGRSYTPRDALRCQPRTAALTTEKVLYAERRPTLSVQNGGSHDREGPIRRETPYAASPGRRLSRQGRSRRHAYRATCD